jgi:hypothetical protein
VYWGVCSICWNFQFSRHKYSHHHLLKPTKAMPIKALVQHVANPIPYVLLSLWCWCSFIKMLGIISIHFVLWHSFLITSTNCYKTATVWLLILDHRNNVVFFFFFLVSFSLVLFLRSCTLQTLNDNGNILASVQLPF